MTMQKYASAVQCGERITAVREQKGWSQRELAKRAGFSNQQISKVETGAVNTPIETLARIAQALAVPMALFFETHADGMPSASSPPTGQRDMLRATLEGLSQGVATLQGLLVPEQEVLTSATKQRQSSSARKQTTLYQKVPIFVPAMPHAYL